MVEDHQTFEMKNCYQPLCSLSVSLLSHLLDLDLTITMSSIQVAQVEQERFTFGF
jgi:hypothetical protein